jgi:hypothetical protein
MELNAMGRVAWLAQALCPGSVRHDSFEIDRHFDSSPGCAVELGRVLHDIAHGPRALATVEGVEVVLTYRTVSGQQELVAVSLADDGRLRLPTFAHADAVRCEAAAASSRREPTPILR